MRLGGFLRFARWVLLAFVLLLGGLGTDMVTIDRADAQEMDKEFVSATPSALDTSSPFAATDLDPPLTTSAPATQALYPLAAILRPVSDPGPQRFPERPHPPPRG